MGRYRLTKRQLARRVGIEIRAAELGIDAPRGPQGQDNGYHPEEYKGWCLNYWDHHQGPRGGVRKIGCTLQDPPETDGQWAGWLAREVYLATWDAVPSWWPK